MTTHEPNEWLPCPAVCPVRYGDRVSIRSGTVICWHDVGSDWLDWHLQHKAGHQYRIVKAEQPKQEPESPLLYQIHDDGRCRSPAEHRERIAIETNWPMKRRDIEGIAKPLRSQVKANAVPLTTDAAALKIGQLLIEQDTSARFQAWRVL